MKVSAKHPVGNSHKNLVQDIASFVHANAKGAHGAPAKGKLFPDANTLTVSFMAAEQAERVLDIMLPGTALKLGEVLVAAQFVPDGVGSEFFLVAFNEATGKGRWLGSFDMEEPSIEENFWQSVNDAWGTKLEFNEGDEESLSAALHSQGTRVPL